MLLTEKLTKDGFFNEMMATFPKATKLFCNWIDEYKIAVGWEQLFNATLFFKKAISNSPGFNLSAETIAAPKFHDLPYELQQGIWIKFATDTLNEHFEQPEYEYSGDLAEDIKEVFAELEKVIDYQEDEGYQTTQKSEGGAN